MMGKLALASARTRPLPPRDAKGRFVAFTTTSAPSWYVFCADGYRIPGDEVAATATQNEAQPATQPQPLPRARVVRRRRSPTQWQDVVSWILITLFVAVVGWRGLHLQVPHRW
jgi:hypothetical protein